MGVTWPLQKYVLAQGVVGPVMMHLLNVIGLFAIMAPIFLLRHKGRLRYPGFSPRWLLLLGLVACVMHFCRKWGVNETSSTTAAVVERSEIFFVFIFSYFILRKPVKPIGWLGTLLVVYGTVAVAFAGSTQLDFHPLGVTALAITGLTIAVNALIIKSKLTGIPNELIILGSMAVQLVVFGIWIGAAGLAPEAQALLALPVLTGLVALASVVWGTNLVLYYYALKRAPMWAVRMLTLSGLPVATLMDLWVLRAPVTWGHVSGLIAAMLGAALVILAERSGPSGSAREAEEPVQAETV